MLAASNQVVTNGEGIDFSARSPRSLSAFLLPMWPLWGRRGTVWKSDAPESSPASAAPESAWVSVVEVGGSRLGNAGATTEMLFDKPNIRGSLTKSPGASHPVNIAPLPLRREPHEIRCHGPLRHGHPFAGPRPRRTCVRRGGGIRHPRDGFKSTARLLSRACRITAASFLVTLYSVSL